MATAGKKASVSTMDEVEKCQERKQRHHPAQRLFRPIYNAWVGDYASVYKLLFTLVLSANIIALAVVLNNINDDSSPLLSCANAAVANLTAAVFIRQPYTLNFLYHITWRVPRSTPLWLRHQLAKVYEFGGIHSGAACSSIMWFCVFAGYLVRDAAVGKRRNVAVLTLVFFLILVLVCIVVTATPQMRRRHHNLFEQCHRSLGWLAIGVFWIALILFLRDQVETLNTSIGLQLIKLPIFWLLLYLSISAIWPWLLLRKVQIVKTERLSDHAIRLYFDAKERVPPQHGAAISKSPLREWHAFAAIDDFEDAAGGSSSVIISRAGDWTADTIANPAPYYYMKGIHQTGVGSTAKMFKRVVYMCTGSGAGPVLAALSLLIDVDLRIIWSAPNPEEIFGVEMCKTLRRWDQNAIIWNTREKGRPDLVELATEVCREHRAEALYFISNRKLTKQVVGASRLRGIAAFAPIFDS
ncbi:Adenylate-forming reductase [Fulvia fulva]|uniref:Adenylate-forming reductase n=1 Tax=Passalora fulva TaxID=5499 RepID=A0A9Q8LDB3_PASFU|nr:Adenylate-forming reductase [Fulvia fulva]KAK4629010.1 Adenylate-forming reductase [Fulvia fulva]KAK4629813.1 Adenylate-forming reductase [Fulvia fulva]UJO15318.1 Adenylate-forming reductase [Fulvia fulva]WPV12114.1 Adenylate-forming reductase [Fulvia fulva]WPV27402.1 Adenylate-forming reductase [Fulvia fulva]